MMIYIYIYIYILECSRRYPSTMIAFMHRRSVASEEVLDCCVALEEQVHLAGLVHLTDYGHPAAMQHLAREGQPEGQGHSAGQRHPKGPSAKREPWAEQGQLAG